MVEFGESAEWLSLGNLLNGRANLELESAPLKIDQRTFKLRDLLDFNFTRPSTKTRRRV